MPTEPWIAHDHPERPLERGAWICGCPACKIALRASMSANPRLRLVAKTSVGRHIVGDSTNSQLSDEPCGEDWLEVFVA